MEHYCYYYLKKNRKNDKFTFAQQQMTNNGKRGFWIANNFQRQDMLVFGLFTLCLSNDSLSLSPTLGNQDREQANAFTRITRNICAMQIEKNEKKIIENGAKVLKDTHTQTHTKQQNSNSIKKNCAHRHIQANNIFVTVCDCQTEARGVIRIRSIVNR